MGVPLTVQDLNYDSFSLRTKTSVFYATRRPHCIKQTILLLKMTIKKCYDENIREVA